MTWRMAKMCETCPFQTSGPGLALRKSLRPGRFADIKRDLRHGGNFLCHKTTDETGNGTKLQCAGALAYQDRLGVSNQLARIAERLEWLASQRKGGRA